jgi:hypothetical protein
LRFEVSHVSKSRHGAPKVVYTNAMLRVVVC